MLQRESIGTDKPPPLVATNLQRPSTEHVSVWQAQFMKRMENVNPSAMLALNPNVLSRPVPPSQAESENQGVPGVNLPCGWLEGYENPEGEEGVNSANFRLGPGRYTLHIRWTRMPQIADVHAYVDLIDINPSDVNDFEDDVAWATVFFPGTRMPYEVIVDRPEGRQFFVNLAREGAGPSTGDLANDAAIIWWFEQVSDATTGASAPGSGNRRRPANPVDEGVEPMRQRTRQFR
ncbi:hypothetical protein MMC15_006979 [Xylographa vitiligo]|nr:hypothetical protein [Xylographa vitiligo]